MTIGGAPPATSADGTGPTGPILAGHDGGVAIGKRYVDEAGTIELLCTKPGAAVPAIAGAVLTLKDAKPLPSSD